MQIQKKTNISIQLQSESEGTLCAVKVVNKKPLLQNLYDLERNSTEHE